MWEKVRSRKGGKAEQQAKPVHAVLTPLQTGTSARPGGSHTSTLCGVICRGDALGAGADPRPHRSPRGKQNKAPVGLIPGGFNPPVGLIPGVSSPLTPLCPQPPPARAQTKVLHADHPQLLSALGMEINTRCRVPQTPQGQPRSGSRHRDAGTPSALARRGSFPLPCANYGLNAVQFIVSFLSQYKTLVFASLFVFSSSTQEVSEGVRQRSPRYLLIMPQPVSARPLLRVTGLKW